MVNGHVSEVTSLKKGEWLLQRRGNGHAREVVSFEEVE